MVSPMLLWSLWSHRSRSFKFIFMFFKYIHLGTCMHCHLSKCVLRKYKYKQTFYQSPVSCEGSVLGVINDRWLHFVDHLFLGVTLNTHLYACVVGYMCWFKFVSLLHNVWGGGSDGIRSCHLCHKIKRTKNQRVDQKISIILSPTKPVWASYQLFKPECNLEEITLETMEH